jgi:hypothetical protein
MRERAESCGLEFGPHQPVQAPVPSYEGKLYNSLSLWYRCWGTLLRRIGHPRYNADKQLIDTKESIHPSALERHERLTTPPQGPYRPQNLIEYLEAHAAENMQERAVGAAGPLTTSTSR